MVGRKTQRFGGFEDVKLKMGQKTFLRCPKDDQIKIRRNHEMKKWLVAIVCIMALCLAACCAVADEPVAEETLTPIVTVAGATDDEIAAGAYSGRYYYRLDFDSSLDENTEIQMGFGSIDSDAPEGGADAFPLSNVYGTAGSRYTFSFPDQESSDYADAMFVRLSDDDPWQKYTFFYDQSKTNGAKAAITNESAPELNQDDFVVNWTAAEGSDLSGADAFYVHWEAPNGYYYPAFYAPGNASYLEIGPNNDALVSRYCRDDNMDNLTGLTDSYGYYTIWIETLKDGQLTESDRWCCAISESAPLLMLNDDNNHPDYVQKNDDGSVSVNLHQWIFFKIYAPYANWTELYALDSLGNLTDPESEGYLLTDENRISTFWPDPDNTGWYDFQWNRNYAPDGDVTAFDQYLVAVSMYDGDPNHNLISEPMTIHVSMDQTLDGTITYSVPDDVNHKENGRYQVARDGFLYVDVDNEGNDADWYGLYIAGDPDANVDYDPSWLADSHWFEKTDGGTTRVRLTVPRCKAGQDCDVHVFGIKYGAKMAEATATIPIHVVEKQDTACPVTLNMDDSFITGEPLMVYAHYSNPNNYNGWMTIRIWNKDNIYDIIHEKDGSFDDYWDVDSCGWHSGTYVVEAEIWEDFHDEPTETYTLKEITIATEDGAGAVADFSMNSIASIGVGQELNVQINKNADDDSPSAEYYYVELVRIDSNGNYYDGKDAEPDENGWAEVQFDGGAFQPGSQFRVTVMGMKPGYDARWNEFQFAVTPDWIEQNLYLTVNGDGHSYQEIESSQNLPIEVGAPGRPTAMRVLNGDDWEYWYGDDENFTRDYGFGEGNTILYAEATWDDRNFDEIHGDEWNQLNWSSRSNVIVLHAESPRGRMKVPEFTIEDAQGVEKTDFALGQHLFVNITDEYPTVVVDEGEPDTPETENWFFCNLFRVERYGNNIHLERVNGDYNYQVQGGVNCILTGNLEPGTYHIEIGADAVGYVGVSGFKEFTIGLNEEEEPMDPTDFIIEGDIREDGEGNLSAPTFTDLRMTAYHPKAEWYNVEITRQVKNDQDKYEDDEGWHDTRDNTRGGMLRDDWRSPQTGIYTFTAYANRHDFRDGFEQNENGDWYCEISRKIVIMATATNEWQDEVQASLNLENGWAHVGDQITLTFTKPENAEEYSYWIHDNDGNWLAGDSRNDLGEMTIDTNILGGTGVYYLEADARATGYEESNTRLTFALLEEDEQPDENGFFSCSADYYEDEYHVGTGDEFRLVYIVPGADEVRLLDNPDLEHLWNGQQASGEFCSRQGPGLTEWKSYDDNEIGNTHEIYGMYRMGDNWSTPVQFCTIKVFGQFYVSKDTVEVCEPLTVYIYAPGAERIRFSGGYDNWYDVYGWNGDNWYNDNVKWEFSADEVDIYAEAMYNGEWHEIGRRHISITKRGDLDEPSIHVPDTVTAPAEQDLAITLDSVENGETYGVNIRRISDGWNEWYEANPDDNGIPTAVIPKEVLDEAYVGYTMTASVIGRGYNAGVSGASFVTVPAVAERSITLEADSDSAQSNMDSVKFTVTAEGAKAVKIYHEGDASFAPTDGNGVAEIELCFDQDTMQPVWASAYYGEANLVIPEDVPEDFDWGNYWDHEYDWSGTTFEGMSNIVYIRVYSDGPTQMPNWVNVPNKVAWGEWLPVEIGDGGNAEVFHIRIHETDGNEVYFMQVESNGTYHLPTTMLEPGTEYFVSICGMRPGCTWDDMEDYHFLVYEDDEGLDPDNVYITADKDKVFPYEPYHVIMHVPGAVELMGVNHEADEDVNFILDGPDAISDDCWWTEDQLGEQTLDIYAKYPSEVEGEDPKFGTDPVGSVTLYVKNRQLEKAEIRVADVVDATSDITIQIPLVENGDHYILEVHNHNTPKWMRIEKDADKDAEEIEPAEGVKEYVINYVIEAGTLNVGEPYWVDCYIGSNDDNYWMSDSSKSIMTAAGNIQPYEDKITLSLKDKWVSDDFGRYQIPINTNFEVVVNNTYAQSDVKPSAIAMYMGDYAEYMYYSGEGQTFTFREYQEWPETIFARAYYGDLSAYRRWEDVPLDQILADTENWGAPTEPILVNFYSEGRVGEPEFGAPRQIFRGDDLTINIFDAGEGADETHANINCNDPNDRNENMIFGDNWVGWDVKSSWIPGGSTPAGTG